LKGLGVIYFGFLAAAFIALFVSPPLNQPKHIFPKELAPAIDDLLSNAFS
jgi:hypothetical protein